MADDMEYYIKFPTATAKDSGEKDDFVFVYDDDKLPVVMLLGWAGCQDKYLSKYSAIYEERGCITVRYTAPPDCIFFRHGRLRALGARLVSLLSDMQLAPSHPVFFHVFSNGGAFLYQHVSQALLQSPDTVKVAGTIFDSAPGERRLASLYRALRAIIGGHWLWAAPAALLVSAFFAFAWLIEVTLRSCWERKPMSTDPIALADEAARWPQMMLYSDADELIRARDVERFAEKRRALGVDVSLVLFPGSPHVRHFSSDPGLYVGSVISFLRSCLLRLESQEKPLPLHPSTEDKAD